MRIELRGIIRKHEAGKEFVTLFVTEQKPYRYKILEMGVDIKVNRGTILTFLANEYDISPGEIVWPDHIEVNEQNVKMSLPL